MNEFPENIPVILLNLNGKIRGFCTFGSDYEPLIVINDQLSPEQKLKTYRHEMEHILRGDLWDDTYNEYGD